MMPGTDLVPLAEQSSFDLLPQANELATAIARTDFVPRGLRGNPAAVMACVLAGHEIGVGPMQSLQKIHVIDGRPAMASELMRALVLRAGHDLWVEESSSTKVTVAGQRAGSDHVTRVTWTLDDAKRANLVGKQNWRNYPRAMLLARATAELCRMVFPDVIGGLSYAVEEVQDGFIFDDPGEPEPVEQAPTQRRKAAAPAAKKATSAVKKAAPAPAAARPQPPLPGEEEGPVANDADQAPPPAEPDNDGQADEVDEVLKKRRQQIAMRCNETGLDRAHLIAAVTGGRITSARELDASEAADCLEALRQIKAGELVLETSGDQPILADPPEPDGDEEEAQLIDEDDPASWDATTWRSFLREHGHKVADTLKWAQVKADELGVDSPGSPGDLAASAELAEAVRAWVLEDGA